MFNVWWFFNYEWLQEKAWFLKHCNKGEDDLFEDKPIDIEKTANLLKFEIKLNKHGEYNDFENSEEVVHDFFKKCAFTF